MFNWTTTAPALTLPVRVAKTAPTAEPLTLDEAKLRAGLDWADGDPRDDLMNDFIRAARAYVEQRTAHAIPSQAQQLFYDNTGVAVGTWFAVPGPSQPIASTTVTSIDTANAEHVLDPAAYTVDRNRGLVQLVGPLPTDVRALEGWRVDLMCGTDAAALDPELKQVIGLLVAHYATLGRDLASITPALEIPLGFEDAIAPFVPQVIP